LAPLAAATAEAGKLLLPRLPVYPQYIHDLSHASSSNSSHHHSSGSSSGSNGGSPAPWLSYDGGAHSVAAAVHRAADSSGLVRANAWVAGKPGQQQQQPPQVLHDGQQQEPQQEQFSEQRDRLQQQMESLHKLVDSSSAHRPAEAQQQQQQQQQEEGLSSSRAATPLPRPRAAKLWNIAVNDLGVLKGMPEPQQVSPRIQRLLQRVLDTATSPQQGQHRPTGRNSSSGSSEISWSESDVQLLLSARGVDMAAVVAAADVLRHAVCGDVVSYVVNRNINYTNVCTYACRFCAFSKVRALHWWTLP